MVGVGLSYNFDEISRKVHNALDILFQYDTRLLEINVHERSISHKLAEYIQVEFPCWNVDCEYNRTNYDPKTLKGIKKDKNNKTGRVYPDIIVHKRMRMKNLLAIEIKKTKHNPKDEKKLKSFTGPEYNYNFGLFIGFSKKHEVSLKWYKNGKKYQPQKNSNKRKWNYSPQDHSMTHTVLIDADILGWPKRNKKIKEDYKDNVKLVSEVPDLKQDSSDEKIASFIKKNGLHLLTGDKRAYSKILKNGRIGAVQISKYDWYDSGKRQVYLVKIF